ncbi:hypothetical protein Mp_6g10430 [Marchantia polymorpha subsp. ruderalis]|uniref:Cx9C motif-containing protein 4 n=2 Tax=Marchantia polymorpha TaxID=3197 RepID=A0AAF6BQK5_MARPO|nr:hypothetical protein MARPO_0016s0085 [Marchantia polymorpha]BBN14289.1 hypothetical protein Mp_6g10430 [Marchantia polymorpha subsp. ruderalis]|eukprot:PTQ45024.1 hypothetical protein MARPO_0016s0085 [Marchantia polymorpha]
MFGFWEKKPPPEPCGEYACEIQACLTKNDFKHERCKHAILKLQKCCEKHDYKSKHCGSLTAILGPSKPKA